MPLITQGYTVKMTKQRFGRGGHVHWEAQLLHNGVEIGKIVNDRPGSQTKVQIPDSYRREAYMEAAKIACPGSYESHARFAERLADVADGVDED